MQGDDVADGEQFVEIDAPDAVLLREILGPEDVGGHDRCPEGRKAGGQRPADAAEPDDAHGGAEQFAGAPAEDAFPCLRIGAGLDGLVRVGQLALEADHRPDDVLCHGDRVLCWRVAYDEAEFRRRRVVHAVESGPCGLDDAHGAEPGQQIGVEAGVRRRHEEAFSARSGLRDGVWPVVGKKSKSAGNLHAAFLETRLGEQTEHMSHCILPGAEFP